MAEYQFPEQGKPSPVPPASGPMNKPVAYVEPAGIVPANASGNPQVPLQGAVQSPLSKVSDRPPTVVVFPGPSPLAMQDAALGSILQTLIKQSQFGTYPGTPTWQSAKPKGV